jgi:ABC-2 type transport system ATP-binding protein
LIHAPELLLLDEPFTGLDVDAAGILSELLREAHGRGVTLLMTTHDVARGIEICQRAVILNRGRRVWDGGISPATRQGFEHAYRAAIHGARPAA